MAGPLNRPLVSPTPEELAAALDAASGNAPSAESRQRWRPILEEVADNAEGRSQLQSLTPGPGWGRYLSAAWWSDHQGRKLVRVCGGRTEGPNRRHFSGMDRDERPPAWHVGPERVYRVRRPGREADWLACCACGEVGPPARLAWTGERCGGCHDRREEGEAVEETVPLFDVGRAVFGLAVSPDARRLAVSSADRVLEVLERDGEPPTDLFRGDAGSEWEELRPLAWSPDGRWIAAVDPREELIRLWEWAEGGQREWEALDTTHDEGGGRCLALTFSPDGSHLAVAFDDGRVLVYRCGGEWPAVGEWFTARETLGPLTSLCFSHDGKALVLGRRRGRVSLLDFGSSHYMGQAELGETRQEVAFVEQVDDGRRLLLLTAPGEEDDVNMGSGSPTATLRLWDFAARAELHTHDLLPPSLIALSPDGRHLAWVIHHPARSPAEVVFWDVAAWRGAGSLEWDCEDTLTALAFSPAGDEIATGSQGAAVKLIPWRQLLGA